MNILVLHVMINNPQDVEVVVTEVVLLEIIIPHVIVNLDIMKKIMNV